MLSFLFYDTATTEIYTDGHTLSLHYALPSCACPGHGLAAAPQRPERGTKTASRDNSTRPRRGTIVSPNPGPRPHQERSHDPEQETRRPRHRRHPPIGRAHV